MHTFLKWQVHPSVNVAELEAIYLASCTSDESRGLTFSQFGRFLTRLANRCYQACRIGIARHDGQA